jgi:glyoxylase-like metal-dependent hydrolase (beta-lactamase superfamily II)
MKFYSYYSVTHFSNCYLLGGEAERDALLIDPGIFDEGLLALIEGNNWYVRHVLLTHAHLAHVNGLRTLRKVYDLQIHALDPAAVEFPAEPLQETDSLRLCGFLIRVLATPGHSNDSACFHIGRMLFTGDTLSAGGIGETASTYERALLLSSIRGKLLGLPDAVFLFPGHGPPSTLEVEKRFNPYLADDSSRLRQ